jgi:hypothetical protein
MGWSKVSAISLEFARETGIWECRAQPGAPYGPCKEEPVRWPIAGSNGADSHHV